MRDHQSETIEVPIKGMDCTECAMHVQSAIVDIPGVDSVDVFLASEKAIVRLDPALVDVPQISRAVKAAGYSVPDPDDDQSASSSLSDLNRRIYILFGIIFVLVLMMVVLGEILGFSEIISKSLPWPVGLAAVLIIGYPVFRGVVRATRNRQITSHTLMTLGAIAAMAAGEWATAVIVVIFMRIGDYVERFTMERSREALRGLTRMAPQTANVLRDGSEEEVPVEDVNVGETIIVRPGERIPVDGEVTSGHATIDQAAITGEPMPVEVGPGSSVFAATIASLGSIRILVSRIGSETTFGQVIKLVEEAEANRGDIQLIADKFSAYYLPVVASIAALTYLISGEVKSTVAVLVVACSCSFALATPIAMLASIGASAKQGILIKGGKYLEALDQADVVLIDKTGTLTFGRPSITDVIPLNGLTENEVLFLAATAERYSEHPLGKAVQLAALEHNVPLGEPQSFKAIPGLGVQAQVKGKVIHVGNPRLLKQPSHSPVFEDLKAQGKTLIVVAENHSIVGVLGASDTLRPEVPEAIAELKNAGIGKIELLTGDNHRTAAALADLLGVTYRADLLPEHKIAIVKEYQSKGHGVVMIGDGVNDAPALAQADVGIAMGAAGTDVAIEAAHVALMRDDWTLVPEVFRVSARTMKVVKGNIGFTTIYNILGLGLAAFGILPPALAAAAQSLPDLGILGNSSRLLRRR